MKIALLAVLGFALGILVAKVQCGSFSIPTQQIQALIQQAQSIAKAAQSGAGSSQPNAPQSLPGAPPESSVAPPPAPAQRPGAKALRPAIEPIYRTLFGSLDDAKALAMAVEETAELERLLSVAPRDAAGESARRVGLVMKTARLETRKVIEAKSQPTSNSFGDGEATREFFGGVADQRWRANMATLAKKCASEWQQFVALDAAASYPREFRGAIDRLMAERHVRDLERSAVLIEGKVYQAFAEGALIEDSHAPRLVYIVGFKDVADGGVARVLAHRAGVHRYKTEEGATRTVEKYTFYRDAK